MTLTYFCGFNSFKVLASTSSLGFDKSPAVINGLEDISIVWTGSGSLNDTEPPVRNMSLATSAPTP